MKKLPQKFKFMFRDDRNVECMNAATSGIAKVFSETDQLFDDLIQDIKKKKLQRKTK